MQPIKRDIIEVSQAGDNQPDTKKQRTEKQQQTNEVAVQNFEERPFSSQLIELKDKNIHLFIGEDYKGSYKIDLKAFENIGPLNVYLKDFKDTPESGKIKVLQIEEFMEVLQDKGNIPYLNREDIIILLPQIMEFLETGKNPEMDCKKALQVFMLANFLGIEELENQTFEHLEKQSLSDLAPLLKVNDESYEDLYPQVMNVIVNLYPQVVNVIVNKIVANYFNVTTRYKGQEISKEHKDFLNYYRDFSKQINIQVHDYNKKHYENLQLFRPVETLNLTFTGQFTEEDDGHNEISSIVNSLIPDKSSILQNLSFSAALPLSSAGGYSEGLGTDDIPKLIEFLKQHPRLNKLNVEISPFTRITAKDIQQLHDLVDQLEIGIPLNFYQPELTDKIIELKIPGIKDTRDYNNVIHSNSYQKYAAFLKSLSEYPIKSLELYVVNDNVKQFLEDLSKTSVEKLVLHCDDAELKIEDLEKCLKEGFKNLKEIHLMEYSGTGVENLRKTLDAHPNLKYNITSNPA